MSLPVCPSAFIRVAAAMCSGSSTFRCRPNLVQLARDDALSGALRLLLAGLVRQVSFLNIRDPHEPVHGPRNGPGRRVRYPSVTGESEFP